MKTKLALLSIVFAASVGGVISSLAGIVIRLDDDSLFPIRDCHGITVNAAIIPFAIAAVVVYSEIVATIIERKK